MKLKQTNAIFIAIAVAVVSCISVLISPQSSSAYTCAGKDSNGLSYVYQNGRCYQVNYKNTAKTNQGQCRSGSELHADGKCWEKSLDSDGAPMPTNDDGSAVKEWRCSDSSAHYNGSDCVVSKTCNSGRSTCEEKVGYQIPNDEEVARKNARESFITDCKAKGYTQQRCEAMATNVENNCAEDAGNAAETTSCLAGEGKKLEQSNPNDPANTACDSHGGWSSNGKCADGTTPGAAGSSNPAASTQAGTCGKDNKVKTNILPCKGEGIEAFGNLLKAILIILTALIGILAVGGIVYAAILYASASDNSSQTQQAMTMIRNIVIGILLYGFMAAILMWLVPGLSIT